MPISPFSGFENAILRFASATGESTINSVGNQVFKTKDIELKAVLKVDKPDSLDKSILEQYSGGDAFTVLLSGYLTEPQALPIGIKAPCIGTAIIESQAGRFEEGKVLLLPTFTSPYLVSLGIPINKIKVYFKS